MASRKIVKRYAMDLLDEMRKDSRAMQGLSLPAIDLAEVIATTPKIIISPHHSIEEYPEDYVMFNIDPESLSVGDVVVIARDPSNQPIILGISDGNNENPLEDLEHLSLHETAALLQENTQHWRSSVDSDSDLPLAGNDDGDLRFSKSSNNIFRWDSDTSSWVVLGVGTYLPLSGGSMSGDITMPTGTKITLEDGPVSGTDAANKDYVDSAISGSGYLPLVTIDSTDSPYSPTLTDHVILVDSSLGSVTINLPASHASGKVYEVKDKSGDADTGNILIVSADGDLIDSVSTYTVDDPFLSVTVVSDGSNWFMI